MARILITGSDRGIGAALAARAGDLGHNVLRASRAGQGGDVIFDVSSPRILTVSSQMSYMGYAKSDRIAYSASKAAVNRVMQGLATDLRPDGIAVVLVDPGWVQIDMGGAEADLTPCEVAAGIITLAETLEFEQTGKFLRWNGEERAF